jgi:hypothetical protein
LLLAANARIEYNTQKKDMALVNSGASFLYISINISMYMHEFTMADENINAYEKRVISGFEAPKASKSIPGKKKAIKSVKNNSWEVNSQFCGIIVMTMN